MMTIQPLGSLVQLGLKEISAGVLDTSSRDSAVEFATVLEIGPQAEGVLPGDKVFVKAWGIDIVNHEDKKYYFVDMTSNALLAVVNE